MITNFFRLPLDFMNDNYSHRTPEESYSRKLDSRVQSQERPYGYSFGEPSADMGNFNQNSLESAKQHKPKRD